MRLRSGRWWPIMRVWRCREEGSRAVLRPVLRQSKGSAPTSGPWRLRGGKKGVGGGGKKGIIGPVMRASPGAPCNL